MLVLPWNRILRSLGDSLVVQPGCSKFDGGISTAIIKKNSSVRRTNSAQAINSADGGIDFTYILREDLWQKNC